MKMNPLGRTGLTVSELCLGTMTFGTQTSEAEGHAQIDRALAAGINFIDTAEMYSVTGTRPTRGGAMNSCWPPNILGRDPGRGTARRFRPRRSRKRWKGR